MVFGIPSFQEALRKLGLCDGAPKDGTSAVPEGESSDAPPEEAVSTPQEAPAGVTPESAAPERRQVLGEDINPWSESPASADRDMPLPDDEATKTASPEGLEESWGGAYRNSMTDGGSKTGPAAPAADKAPPPTDAPQPSQPAAAAQPAAAPQPAPASQPERGGEEKAPWAAATGAPSAGGSSPSDSRPVSGAQEIPVEDVSIGIFNALSDGIGSVVKTTSSVGSLVATEARLRVKAIRSESASEFGALRKFVTKLVCGTKDEKSNEV